MSKKKKRHEIAHVIEQTPAYTVVKCPKCKGDITLHHEGSDYVNSGIGRIDLGVQNYELVVCMSEPKGVYCEFSGRLSAAKKVWL